MIFTDPGYPLFLLVALAVYWWLSSTTARKSWLLLISSVFYGAWDIRFLALLYFTTLADYAFAKKISSVSTGESRKRWVVVSVVMNLLMLGLFKYFNFFTSGLILLLSVLGVPAVLPQVSLLLPIGISFYTFQSLSYVIDVYRKKISAVSFPDFL